MKVSEILSANCPTINFKEQFYQEQLPLPRIYDNLKGQVKKMLQAVNERDIICFTTDIWISRAKHSYITATAHFLTDDFQLKTVNLDTRHFLSNHTADNISNMIDEVLKEWGLNTPR